ncbi:Mg2+ transporter [Cordyceps militaris]|uniref:Mg2+ transporter n=1 Tax=Cordyceps militaris TaxID=73501 RepID=A0A2H4S8B7_CORMI|nr:Mg2+ transporter [Cordyceps militaris]
MDPYYSSEEDRRVPPPRRRSYRAEPRRTSYYGGEPSRQNVPLPSRYNVYPRPQRRSSRPRQHRPAVAHHRYMPMQEERLAQAIPIIGNPESRTAVFTEQVPQYASRYRASPSPPGIQPPRPIFMERASREDRIRPEKERERQEEETRYAFGPPESDGSEVDIRARARARRSPSPPIRVRERTRSYSRSPSARVIYPVAYDVIDWENYEDFSFDCDKSEALKNSDSLSFDTSSADPDTAPVGANQLTDDAKVKQIFYSRYTGDAETGGNHTAQLIEIHNGSGELFKWLHIQLEVMSFDEFWNETTRRVHVSDTERRAMNRLRADVTRLCIKTRSNPKGVNVGYLEPQFLQTPLEQAKKKTELDREEPISTMVRWFCMPFFILKQYSGLLAGSSLASFPSQTLLQSQYSRTTQQRDMGQAVCELGIANKGECFHIEQLWCLVVGDGLLVTCGSMPRSKLEGDVIKLTSEPSRGLSGAAAPGRILVKYGNSLTWNFSPEQCPTWFDFITQFTAFWPMALEFKKEETILTARDWPKLLKFLSVKRNRNVVLTLNIDRNVSAASRALPTPEEQAAAAKASTNTSDMPLHTLALIIQSSEKGDKPPVASELKLQLDAADKFLMEQPAYATQAAYTDCADISHGAALEKLKLEGAEVEGEKNDIRKREYEDGIELFSIAESLFQVFLPLTCDGPTTGKFWGAVLDLACGTRSVRGKTPEVAISRRRVRDLRMNQEAVLRSLRVMYPKLRAFQAIMSHVPNEYRLKLEAPRQFVTAWLHVISGLVLCRAGDSSWESHLSIAQRRLLSDGMDRMIHGLPAHDLLDSVVLQPFEIASLAVLKLMQDRASQPDDINETYSQYLASLDNDITTKPSDRSYQHRIDLVRRELSAVRRTVTRQRQIIATMRQTMYPNAMTDFFRGGDEDVYMHRGRYGNHPRGTREYYTDVRREEDPASFDYTLKVSPTDKNGFRGLLLTENSKQLDQRDFEFRRYVEYVDDLERTIAFKMNWTKDRQENAVYAFTIVTIIFLPLSAVASIFGMNTSDVRDMDFSQWLFWVVALPVTILVIVVGLWWMNELGSVMRWLTGQQPSAAAAGSTGYGGVTAEQAEFRYYSDVEEDKPRRYSARRTLTESPLGYNSRRRELRQRRV